MFDVFWELGDIIGLYLVDEEGILFIVEVSVKFLNGKFLKIES